MPSKDTADSEHKTYTVEVGGVVYTQYDRLGIIEASRKQAVREFGEKLIGNMYQTFMRDYCPESCNGFGTYSERDSEGDPEPAQCQWCDEQRLPILNKLRTAIQEAMEEER